MKSLKAKRILVAVSMLAGAAAAMPIATAAPAAASAYDCTYYLKQKGYTVGSKVKAICDGAYKHRDSLSQVASQAACKGVLYNLGVKTNHADRACRLAANLP
ncbi:hypothetical protein ACIG3E_00300 [Streptomyces sp. NPDC053474]|uniref:hypothetical protein n=1 Tax=Streptomyces sp. NPDC053474 TaxID=3365704 RepID=UPI0037D7ED01